MPLLNLAIKDLFWSLLAASFPFVHVVFSAKCFQPPSPRAASVTARIKPCEREKRLAPGGRNRCTTQKPDFFFYSPRPCCHRRRLETSTSDGPRSSRERHAYFTTGTRCSRRQLHSSSRLFDRRQSRRGGRRGGLVARLSLCCSLTTCKMASIPT